MQYAVRHWGLVQASQTSAQTNEVKHQQLAPQVGPTTEQGELEPQLCHPELLLSQDPWLCQQVSLLLPWESFELVFGRMVIQTN